MALDAAIVGPGNIGTDLMYKILDRSENIDLQRMIGIFPVEESDGLQAAVEEDVDVGTNGIESVKEYADEFDVVFEATSAKVHAENAPVYDDLDLFAIDLTPAAVGPYTVPVVNFDDVAGETRNINMVTCGGQATIPIVHAVDRTVNVEYAEMISTIASKSAGPGTRQNIDEFTQSTSAGIEQVGGADDGKAIIVLNPAEPPILMRNTIYTQVPDTADLDAVRDSVAEMEAEIRSYVPGYEVTLEPELVEQDGVAFDLGDTVVLTTMIEVEGEGQYLPPYAGNLDIMTSAALGAAERLATHPTATVVGGASDD
ncbi:MULTISPECIES: acetaldehyde dehydrogenase (acetylating) [unclassified Haladaptatus]|uniref:acetaldehyde dehydrogenase (acetylating) n=1 Tax=unclassified Haladaptatus TaxID=2622732 RepID=UPI00209C53C1|nr:MULTISPECIES: acetaldehyde dehydrogenase (acetylating) [unclassified Haladaptatus]MCO8243650.1 acetaldehyde dehydrogenase (acetylating) [Haladaptatus sp. AB643]MCO8255059.1 acetaldehyde dehydrogenase (acetylating) [Haladaptatus sp. AB618]